MTWKFTSISFWKEEALVGECHSVAHQKMFLWRMVGAPQNPRHKNIISVAHPAVCGAPCRAPQKVENSVAHFQNAPQKYCSCATEILVHALMNLTIIYLWRTYFVRHSIWCATKLFTMRH